MRPDDDPSLNTPSAPPPDQLPRPRFRPISDIRPTSPISSSAPVQSEQQDIPPVVSRPLNDIQPSQGPQGSQSQQGLGLPHPVHPGDRLLSAPRHEDLLASGLPSSESMNVHESPRKKRSKWKVFGIIFAILVVLAGIIAAGMIWWYQQQLRPVDSAADEQTRVVIVPGSAPAAIADQLKDRDLIRSSTAFSIYINLSKTRDILKAGTYNLQKSESVEQIVGHLVSGKQDTFRLTFLPGDTLANHTKKIIQAGYSEAEVTAALTKKYSGALFAGKPASADLEGYIYGETYEFLSSATVEDILQRTFTEFESKISEGNIIEGLKKQGFSLYQGITLASIVQREVPTSGDQKQVAQVFYNRLKTGMNLGSDVTYQYAADKLGVERTPLLDSPYNTRKYAGLTPGPIASPGLSSLQAVATPATGNYLFFLSGDDDTTYFARTNAEHEANIAQHCKEKCLIP